MFLRFTIKDWYCFFTCFSTRVVHIKDVDGLDTDACMIAIARFMTRQDRPQTLISDSGTNFVVSAGEIEELAKE